MKRVVPILAVLIVLFLGLLIVQKIGYERQLERERAKVAEQSKKLAAASQQKSQESSGNTAENPTEFLTLTGSTLGHEGSLSRLTVTMESPAFRYTFVCNTASNNCFAPQAGRLYALLTRNNYEETGLADMLRPAFSKPDPWGETIFLMPHDAQWWSDMKEGKNEAVRQIAMFYLIKSEPLKQAR